MPEQISFTQIAAWKQCRYRWYWQYHRNLERVKQGEHLTLGSLCHTAMEAFLKDQEMWGAMESLIQDRIPEMWDEEKNEAFRLIDTAHKIVSRMLAACWYSRYQYETLAVEKEFRVRIPGTRNFVGGRFDLITRDAVGDPWLVEWKFPKTFKSEDDCALSTQLALYQWAAITVGFPVVGVMYNQTLQRLPEVPSENKNGSTSRKEIFTDWQTYKETVQGRGDDPELYEEEMRPKLADKEFFRSYRLYRTPEQVLAFVQDLKAVSSELNGKNKRLYFCETPSICAGCSFRDLCLEVVRGRSPEPMVESLYQQRTHHDTNGVKPA